MADEALILLLRFGAGYLPTASSRREHKERPAMRHNDDIKNQQELLNAAGPGPDPTVDDTYFPDPKNAGVQPDIGSVLENARKVLEHQSPAQQQAADAEGVPLNLHLAPYPNQHGGPDRANTKEPPFINQSDRDMNPERWSQEQQVIDNEYNAHA